MSDRNDYIFPAIKLPADETEARLTQQRRDEKRAAAAFAFDAMAYRQMPEDIRQRAREWDMEAFMCQVWNNAWQCGYLQAGRDYAQGEGRADG